MLFSGYCKPNIFRNFLLSISTLNIFRIYNGAHHVMFLNFRAPNSYKLHAYKNWIINTLIKNSESMFRLCIMKLLFFLLKFVVIWFYCFILFVIFLVWMVLNAFYQVIAPNWSQCVSQPTTRRGWICEDLRETDRRVIRWLYLLYNDSLLWGNPGIYDQIRKPASTKKMNL